MKEFGQLLLGRSLLGHLMRLPLFLYLALATFAFFFSERLIFLPPAATYPDHDILKLTTRDGERIAAIYLPNPNAPYTLLYSHGNAEDLGRIRDRLEKISKLGFAIFAYDYRGYGRSDGVPSEQNAYRDIDAAYRHVTQVLRIPPDRIILYGRSLGGGPSVDLAVRQPVAGMILENTFTSTFRVVTRISILPWDRFNNLDKISAVRCPVLFLHGTADIVVPYHHSRILFDRLTAPKQFLTVEGAGHNDLWAVAGEQYNKALHQFVTLVDQPSFLQ